MFMDNSGDQGLHRSPVDNIIKELKDFYGSLLQSHQDLLNENHCLREIVRDLRRANQQLEQAFHASSTAQTTAQQELSSLKAGYTTLERKLASLQANENALNGQVQNLIEDQTRTIEKLKLSYDESDHLLELLQKCRVTRDIEKHGRKRCEERIAEMEYAASARYSPFPVSINALPSMGTTEVLPPPVIPASSPRTPVLDQKGGKTVKVRKRDRANIGSQRPIQHQPKVPGGLKRKSSGGAKSRSRGYTRHSPDPASKILKGSPIRTKDSRARRLNKSLESTGGHLSRPNTAGEAEAEDDGDTIVVNMDP